MTRAELALLIIAAVVFSGVIWKLIFAVLS